MPDEFSSGAGITVSTSEPFRLGLGRGFNFVANPYKFPGSTVDQVANASGGRFGT